VSSSACRSPQARRRSTRSRHRPFSSRSGTRDASPACEHTRPSAFIESPHGRTPLATTSMTTTSTSASAPPGQSGHWLPVRAAADRKQKSGLSAVGAVVQASDSAGPPAWSGGRRIVVVGGQRVSPAVAEMVGWRRERTASMISLGSIPCRYVLVVLRSVCPSWRWMMLIATPSRASSTACACRS
jgi:hypothetical protein